MYGKPVLTVFVPCMPLITSCFVPPSPTADNPSGDIRGANAAGPPWVSNLVRTGVYRGTGGENNDALDPAHFVHDHVGDCVDFILEREAKASHD